MAQTKIEQGLLKFTEATDYLKIPTGTTAQRPSSPANGYIRFNTTINDVEAYNGTEWTRMGVAPPTFTSVDYPGSATALDPAGGESLVINGTNFDTGITLKIDETTPSSITRNSDTQLTVTAPAKAAGTYNIVFTNSDGGTATALNAVIYNASPVFSTAAGSLGSILEGESVNVTVAASEADGGTITFAVTSGSLPSGVSLNSSTGAITGTAPSVAADTTFNFTITATDDENQTEARAFSLTIQNDNPSFTFSAHLYTGTGYTQTPSDNTAFKPDMMMLTDRPASGGGALPLQTSMDVQKTTFINQTNPYGSYYYTTFNSPTGYSIYGSGGVQNNNTTADAYIIWLWKVNGGTTVTNSDGNVNTTVQLNTDKGITMGKMSSTPMTSSQTFGHGMGSEPDCLWVINTDQTGYEKRVYFKDVNSWDGFLKLNATDALYTSGINSTVNSSTFSLQWTGSSTNADWLFIAFKSIAGFSKFGTFTGSSRKRTPVHLGFAPATVILKNTSSTSDWYIYDNKRPSSGLPFSGYNNQRRDGYYESKRSVLRFDTQAEGSDPTIRFAEGGFVLNGTNFASGTWSYMAFAKDPLATTPSLANSFKTVTYTGSGSNQDITSVGFRPGLTWIKCRSQAKGHNLHDQVRVMHNSSLTSSSTAAENNENHLTKTLSNGFTVNDVDSGSSNENTFTYVAWNWKAAEHPSILTSGTIDSIVSANPAAGFSIVKWNGNGSASTIGHGLSSAPEMVITKRLSGVSDWYTYHKDLNSGTNPAYNFIKLNSSDAEIVNASSGGSIWNSTSPSSTVINIGTSLSGSSDEYVAYCFHSVSGYSKIGSYSGGSTGSSNVITTGFQPDWIMIKRTDTADDWTIIDSVRGDGASSKRIIVNTSEVEKSAISIWFPTSTGFYFSGTGASYNSSGGTYIYAAFKIN